jgi:hypothetical protein
LSNFSSALDQNSPSALLSLPSKLLVNRRENI